MVLNCGLIQVGYNPKTQKYHPPESWRVLEAPQPLHTIPVRSALKEHYYHMNNEVWILPLHEMSGAPVVRPSKQGTPEQMKNELGLDLAGSAVFIDLDHRGAHKGAQQIQAHEREALNTVLMRFQNLGGWFFHNTLRGARCGLLFQEPIDLENVQLIKLELCAQLDQALTHIKDQWFVDRQCLELTRVFAAPHINKLNQGAPIPPELVNLWISDTDLSMSRALQIAQAYKARQSRLRGSGEPVDSNRQTGERSTRTRKHAVIPNREGIDQLDGTEQYQLSLSAMSALCKIVKNDELRATFLRAIDQEVMGGRRATKEPSWFDRTLKDFKTMYPTTDQASIAEAPPSSIDVEGLNELSRVWTHNDEATFAQVLFDVYKGEHLPVWHGSGLRRYDKAVGVWDFHDHHSIKRVALRAQGAVDENGKKISFSNNKVEGAIKLLASQCGAGKTSPFDTAPAGVVIGQHFISLSTVEGLKVEPPQPHHYAIHALDYTIPQSVLTYWATDGDEGHAPRRPPVFTQSFLHKCLSPEPGSDGENEVFFKV